MLRKLYAGNGGVLPPTDPRILNMTEAQIEIELEHFLIDLEERDKDKNKEQYEDAEFDNYDKDTDEVDNRLFWEPGGNGSMKKVDLPKMPETTSQKSEWVDVEIDNDEDW